MGNVHRLVNVITMVRSDVSWDEELRKSSTKTFPFFIILKPCILRYASRCLKRPKKEVEQKCRWEEAWRREKKGNYLSHSGNNTSEKHETIEPSINFRYVYFYVMYYI